MVQRYLAEIESAMRTNDGRMDADADENLPDANADISPKGV